MLGVNLFTVYKILSHDSSFKETFRNFSVCSSSLLQSVRLFIVGVIVHMAARDNGELNRAQSVDFLYLHLQHIKRWHDPAKINIWQHLLKLLNSSVSESFLTSSLISPVKFSQGTFCLSFRCWACVTDLVGGEVRRTVCGGAAPGVITVAMETG